MTDEPTEATTGDEVTALVDAPKDARDEAHERAQACASEIDAVLDKYKCRILPRIDPAAIEPVGMAGNKIQVEATYWIAPMAS